MATPVGRTGGSDTRSVRRPRHADKDAVGVGAGSRDSGPMPNLLLLFVGHRETDTADTVVELAANLDDCPGEFLAVAKQAMELVEMKQDFLDRAVNAGFSGGEKKRNEILQMAVMQPRLAVLDETDSGLDIDALKLVAEGVNRQRSPERSMIVVTHYQRLLDYIEPDYVHVLFKGRIVKSGDSSLAKELEKHGYEWIRQEVDMEI